MRKFSAITLILLAAAITSCTSKAEKDKANEATTEVQSIPEMPPISVDTASFNNPDFNQAAAPAVAGTAQAMNPAHGQPGHRCDIPVGAPLNSPKNAQIQTPAAPAQQVPPPVTTTTAPKVQPAATTETAPGMNPPHGQPGHRCDIPVGSPLSSAPEKK